MIGRTFGYLTVISEIGKYNGNKIYKCECECGEIKYVNQGNLTSGRVKSCGCMKEKLRMEALEKKKTFKVYEKLTVDYIEKRIEELREGIKHLQGKTPNMMNKRDSFLYYSTMFRICELLDLINKGA